MVQQAQISPLLAETTARCAVSSVCLAGQDFITFGGVLVLCDSQSSGQFINRGNKFPRQIFHHN
jgi:hypothetical protein